LPSQAAARLGIFGVVEVWQHRFCLHPAPGYLSPGQFEHLARMPSPYVHQTGGASPHTYAKKGSGGGFLATLPTRPT
jgi:hypothetical protein